MAKLNFNEIANQPMNEGGEQRTGSGVRFFALKPNESAIVRILCDSVDDFDIHTVHNVVTEQWKFGKRMNCLREAHDPIDACPLCAAGKPLMQKFFIKMIHYVTDPQTNQIVPTPVVWERGVNDRVFGARAIMNMIETYGALSPMICKITRTGEKLETQYQFIPNLPAHVYPENLYPATIPEVFTNFSVIGTMVPNKTAEEYAAFLATGSFPNPNAQATPRAAEPTVSVPPMNNQPAYTMPQTAAPSYMNAAAQQPTSANTVPTYTTPAANPSTMPAPSFNQPARQQLPWETPNSTANAGGFERPVRRY